MVPRDAWSEYADRGVVERLDLTAELAQWSGVATAGSLGTGFGELGEPVGVGR
jgi:hypothetical protein